MSLFTKRTKLIATLATGLTLSLAASARAITVRGEGSALCAAWTQEHNSNSTRKPVQESWLLGYVNAVSGILELPGVDDVSSAFHNEDLVAWVDDYCRSHPNEEVIRAADALMHYLARRVVGDKDKL
jgi:hypothetical protein